MLLPTRSDTDLIYGRAIKIATDVAAVTRSATAVAAATCSSAVRELERVETPALEREFVAGLLESSNRPIGVAKTGGLLAIGTRALLIALALENNGTTNIGGRQTRIDLEGLVKVG